MILYKFGKIVHQNGENIIYEAAENAYSIKVNPNSKWALDVSSKLYIYEHRTEYSEQLYGFKTFRERVLFADLISISGIGPKIAFSILNEGWEKVAAMIVEKNIDLLSVIPYVNAKVASTIIFTLEKKMLKMIDRENAREQINVMTTSQQEINELETSLKVLGYQKRQIKYALDHIDAGGSLEELIERAIVAISQAPEFRN
ncbi:Holliday junction branch migration protein RuvA [Mycoplasmopsis agassizii]|uniref:Holliday junction branch migration protein RuvA n=1 Tax=Mycoplasmopsis agassizii TaxID=33922 RepID=UPI0035294BC5